MIDLLEREELDLDQVGILVIDEADRMADMGFLPQVEWIMRKVPNEKRQTLLFSATLDREVDVLVRRYMHDPVRHEVAADEKTIDDMTHRFLTACTSSTASRCSRRSPKAYPARWCSCGRSAAPTGWSRSSSGRA